MDILDNFLRQWIGIEDFNVLNFSKILLEFAFVFKVFEYFGPFRPSITIITGRRNFLSLADGLLDKTLKTKNGFEHFFAAKSGNFCFKFYNILQIFKISDLYLICLLTRLEN